jgi:hypothetical protein
VRTKALETVETRCRCWQLMAGRDHTYVQFIGSIWLLVANPGISRLGLGPIYGSEGWGFESLRARWMLWQVELETASPDDGTDVQEIVDDSSPSWRRHQDRCCGCRWVDYAIRNRCLRSHGSAWLRGDQNHRCCSTHSPSAMASRCRTGSRVRGTRQETEGSVNLQAETVN